MKRAWILLLILLSFTISSAGQDNISSKTNKIVRTIIKTSQYGKEFPSFYSYIKEGDDLARYAKVNELLNLMKHKNSVVKAFSYSALVKKLYPNIFEVLIENIENKEKIERIGGDIKATNLLIDYFIEEVDPAYSYQDKRDSLHMTKNELIILDSLLIFKDAATESTYLENALLSSQPKSSFYNRIKFLAYNLNPGAIVALARYNNENDTELIKQCIFNDKLDYYAMLSIKEFPNNVFFDDLSKKLNDEIRKSSGFDYMMLKVMYQAIVQYKNKNALKLIIKSLNDCTPEALKYHKVYISLAIKKYPNKIFDVLSDKIILNDFQRNEVDAEINQ